MSLFTEIFLENMLTFKGNERKEAYWICIFHIHYMNIHACLLVFVYTHLTVTFTLCLRPFGYLVMNLL